MSTNPPQPTAKTHQEEAQDQVEVIKGHLNDIEILFAKKRHDSPVVVTLINDIHFTLLNLMTTLDSILSPSSTPRWTSLPQPQPAKSSDSSGCILFFVGLFIGAGLILYLKR